MVVYHKYTCTQREKCYALIPHCMKRRSLFRKFFEKLLGNKAELDVLTAHYAQLSKIVCVCVCVCARACVCRLVYLKKGDKLEFLMEMPKKIGTDTRRAGPGSDGLA